MTTNGWVTAAPVAPPSATARARRTVSAMVTAPQPTKIGTWPFVAFMAAAATWVSSPSFSAHCSPLSPATRKPVAPQLRCHWMISSKASNMMSPFSENGVTTAGTRPWIM